MTGTYNPMGITCYVNSKEAFSKPRDCGKKVLELVSKLGEGGNCVSDESGSRENGLKSVFPRLLFQNLTFCNSLSRVKI
jgi:hypothetical protein